MTKSKYILVWCITVTFFLSTLFFVLYKLRPAEFTAPDVKITEIKNNEEKKSHIKWAEFNLTSELMKKASEIDIETKGEISWIDLLAYTSAKSFGNINKDSLKYVDECREKLLNNENIEDIKYFKFYKEVYTAVLSEFIGKKGNDYGIIAYSPIAKGYSYNHYNDFGQNRNFGFKRPHKGNDLLGKIGTPIISVEGGVIEALGWNTFGGWRIGIRSFDKKRYYYYAHLRKDTPFRDGLKVGDEVYAGEVIGYMGRTGYSQTENVNNVDTPHLHFGIQLIFSEEQKDSPNEIWIDVYNIVKFLDENRSEVIYNEETNSFSQKNQ